MDFTHNITHELKTPIAVAYAANDALENFGAADDGVRRAKYLGCDPQPADGFVGDGRAHPHHVARGT